MHEREAKFYGEALMCKKEAMRKAMEIQEAVERIIGIGRNALGQHEMAIIAAVAQVFTPKPAAFSPGDKVDVNGVPGEFVCYWRDKARVKFACDDKNFRICEIERITHA